MTIKYKNFLEIFFCAFLFVAIFLYAAWGITHWKSTKPEPRYKNTLQRDIN